MMTLADLIEGRAMQPVATATVATFATDGGRFPIDQGTRARGFATATAATFATHEVVRPRSVARVASVAVANVGADTPAAGSVARVASVAVANAGGETDALPDLQATEAELMAAARDAVQRWGLDCVSEQPEPRAAPQPAATLMMRSCRWCTHGPQGCAQPVAAGLAERHVIRKPPTGWALRCAAFRPGPFVLRLAQTRPARYADPTGPVAPDARHQARRMRAEALGIAPELAMLYADRLRLRDRDPDDDRRSCAECRSLQPPRVAGGAWGCGTGRLPARDVLADLIACTGFRPVR